MTHTIKELRVLPPFAIARLGSADEPMDNYTIELDAPENQDQPLGYRALKPLPTLIVGERSGEIEEVRIPQLPLQFKVHGKNGEQIRPVAPFLEVFAVVETGRKEDELVPLTVELLSENGLSVKDVSWTVSVANRKVARRTGDDNDVVKTDKVIVGDHDIHTLHGHCNNFESTHDNSIEFGQVRFIKPNAKHPEIRLRFTPARGLIYGPKLKAGQPALGSGSDADFGDDAGPPYAIPPNQDVYDPDKGIWAGYQDTSDHWEPGDQDPQELKAWKKKRNEIWARAKWDPTYDNETLPPGLYAINPPAPSWLYDNIAISRGYLDDACDGFVEVRIARPGEDPDKSKLKATARICSGPPAMAPDSLFVRSLADDLNQVVLGPDIDENEDPEITRARAQDIVRRAFETVRFMNVVVMNGNNFKGRPALSLDSMPEEEAADTERAIRPVMHPGSVDTKAITALHQQAYAALRAGTAPWFGRLLRQPDEAADFTDRGRRKMPALMCAADNNYLALTWRQIHTIEKAAMDPPPGAAAKPPAVSQRLTPRNLSAQIHHEAKGNPISSRPITSVANCCPGLEVDFRAVWRRLFKGIELREYDNLVVSVDPDEKAVAGLRGKRLLRIWVGPDPEDAFLTMTKMYGPASSDPDGRIELVTELNPAGLAPLEWSNALAYVLAFANEQRKQEPPVKVRCDFSKDDGWDQQLPLTEATDATETAPATPANYVSLDLEVRPFFDGNTAVISRDLAEAGELTQGLCSPWQNDYRECSCYYWASARPDFVNVDIDAGGLSKGDNWFQRTRTGSYVPDDYADSRLIMYDELFNGWEKLLKFQIGGRDADDSAGPGATGKKV